MAIPSGLILQWGNDLYRTDLKWPPNKPKGTSIWRDRNGDGDYQADEFAPNSERCIPARSGWTRRATSGWPTASSATTSRAWMARATRSTGRQDHRAGPAAGHEESRPRLVISTTPTHWWSPTKGSDMRHIGRVFICQRYLAGNRETCRSLPAPGRKPDAWRLLATTSSPAAGRSEAGSGSIACATARRLGAFDPGPTVGGVENTGWIDILTGITAYQRSQWRISRLRRGGLQGQGPAVSMETMNSITREP